MSDAAEATVQEILGEVGLAGTARLLHSAVASYDHCGDPDDILGACQLEVIERLRPIACKVSVTGDDLRAIDAWDLLAILTTAVELYDHGADARLDDCGADGELASTIEAVRPFTCLNQDDDDEDDDMR